MGPAAFLVGQVVLVVAGGVEDGAVETTVVVGRSEPFESVGGGAVVVGAGVVVGSSEPFESVGGGPCVVVAV